MKETKNNKQKLKEIAKAEKEIVIKSIDKAFKSKNSTEALKIMDEMMNKIKRLRRD